jgi:hypothetical protein
MTGGGVVNSLRSMDPSIGWGDRADFRKLQESFFLK